MSLSATDKRALQVLRTRMTFAELADALGVNADSRRRTLDGRLQDMVRAGLVGRAKVIAPATYQTTAEGARKLAAAVNAERRRSRPPRRETTETEREDWGW